MRRPAAGTIVLVDWGVVAHHVTSISLKRVQETSSRITADQLANLRRRIALALGL